MDAEELGMLSSALAGGRDCSSIKQRGAVTCVLSCLKQAGKRENHSTNPLPSEPEHLQGWGGKGLAASYFSSHHLWFLQSPRDRTELETSGLLETPLQGLFSGSQTCNRDQTGCVGGVMELPSPRKGVVPLPSTSSPFTPQITAVPRSGGSMLPLLHPSKVWSLS